MRNFSRIKLISVFLLSFILAGCGFHLRDNYDVPEQLSTLSVTSYDQYSEFTRLVKAQLHLENIEIVTPGETIPNLHLSSESLSSRTLSIYQNNSTAEVELTLKIAFNVTIPDIGSRQFTTSVTRSYIDNPLTALAKSVEKSMLVDEMRRLAAERVIRQMARLKVEFEDDTPDTNTATTDQ